MRMGVQQVLNNCPMRRYSGGAGKLEAQAAEIRSCEEADLLEACDRARREDEERAFRGHCDGGEGGDGLSGEPYLDGRVPSTPSPCELSKADGP
eukprot:10098068-Alexandrium_andersonii.AAC.1